MSSPATTHISGSIVGELSDHSPFASPSTESLSLGGTPSSSAGEHLANDSARSDSVSPSAVEYQRLVESPASEIVVSSVPEEHFVAVPDPSILSAALRVAAYHLALRDESRRYDEERRAHSLKWADQVSRLRDVEAAALVNSHQEHLSDIESRFNNASA